MASAGFTGQLVADEVAQELASWERSSRLPLGRWVSGGVGRPGGPGSAACRGVQWSSPCCNGVCWPVPGGGQERAHQASGSG